MASPTLMTCSWSGVKATWRTGSEWPMNTWERAHLESPISTCPVSMGLLHSLSCTARVYRPQQKVQKRIYHTYSSHT